MGFLEVLTIIFVFLKAFSVITWSWWAVFIPMYIAFAIYVVMIVLWLATFFGIKNKFK